MEKWKDIAGYKGLYQVSNTGNIRRLYRNGFKSLKTSRQGNGYYHVILRICGKSKIHLVHRLVLSAFKPIDNAKEVNHVNGNKSDNCLNNLEWCSHSRNITHAWESGLMNAHLPRLRKRVELMKKPVIAIRTIDGNSFYFHGQAEAEARLNLPQGTISQILNEKSGRKQSKGFTFTRPISS